MSKRAVSLMEESEVKNLTQYHDDSLKITDDIMKELKKSRGSTSTTLKKYVGDLKDYSEEEREKDEMKVRHDTLKKTMKKQSRLDPHEESDQEDDLEEGEKIHREILSKLKKIKKKKSQSMTEEELLKEKVKKLERENKELKEDLQYKLEQKKKEQEHSSEFLRKRIFKKADIQKLIQDETLVYLNINSFSKRGEHLYKILRETLPLAIDKKFSLIGLLKKQKKKYFFVIHKKLLYQYWYFSRELDEIVRVTKKKQGKKIRKEFRAYYLPNMKFIKKTITLIPKKGYVAVNNLYEVGTLK